MLQAIYKLAVQCIQSLKGLFGYRRYNGDAASKCTWSDALDCHIIYMFFYAYPTAYAKMSSTILDTAILVNDLWQTDHGPYLTTDMEVTSTQ